MKNNYAQLIQGEPESQSIASLFINLSMVFKKAEEVPKERRIFQSFRNSCVPFAIANLFAQLLHSDEKSYSRDAFLSTLRILEAAIYPNLWKSPYEVSVMEAAISYMGHFLKPSVDAKTAIISISKNIDPRSLTEDYALFARIRGGEGHLILITLEKGKLVCNADQEVAIPNWQELLDRSESIFQIKKSSINIPAIKSLVEFYDRNRDILLCGYKSVQKDVSYPVPEGQVPLQSGEAAAVEESSSELGPLRLG